MENNGSLHFSYVSMNWRKKINLNTLYAAMWLSFYGAKKRSKKKLINVENLLRRLKEKLAH